MVKKKVQEHNSLSIGVGENVELAVCTIVEFGDYHGIYLFDTSWFFSNMFEVI